MADVVIDDSMHKIAAIASSLVTSSRNISLAWAMRKQITVYNNKNIILFVGIKKSIAYLGLNGSNSQACEQ